jgi:hypothetical protein
VSAGWWSSAATAVGLATRGSADEREPETRGRNLRPCSDLRRTCGRQLTIERLRSAHIRLSNLFLLSPKMLAVP